LLPQTSLLHT